MELIETYKKEIENGNENPRDIKYLLAEEIVARFHGGHLAAEEAKRGFINQFAKGAIPDDIPEHAFETGNEGYAIANLLKDAGLCSSTTDAMRMIQQGAVRIDGDRVDDKSLRVMKGTDAVFQVGKRRFAKVSVS